MTDPLPKVNICFNTWRKEKQLSSEQASKLLGTSRANGFKYASGTRSISLPIAYAMEVIDMLDEPALQALIARRLTED